MMNRQFSFLNSSLLFICLGIAGTASATDAAVTPVLGQALDRSVSLTLPSVTATEVVLTDRNQPSLEFAQIDSLLVPRFANNSQISAARSRNSKAMDGTQTLTAEQQAETVDMGKIDHMLSYLLEHAGNYPPRFGDREERKIAAAEVRTLIEQVDQYAVHPNASLEVLLRAVQLNQIGRNLDLGVGAAIKAGVYMRRAIALNPDDPRANYWYGTMLVEGGGMKEGVPYLNRAVTLGYKPAHLVLAQAYLHLDRREFALKALQSYHEAEPAQQEWTAAVTEKIRAGKSLIWSD